MITSTAYQNFRIQPVSGVTNVNTRSYSQSSEDESSFTQQSATLNFSSDGLRLSNMMTQLRNMDSEEIRVQLEEIKGKFDGLDLDEFDAENMSRDALEEKINEIQEVMAQLDSGGSDDEIDVDQMTDEALIDFIEGFKGRAEGLSKGINQLEGMVGTVTMGGTSTTSRTSTSAIPAAYQSFQAQKTEASDEMTTPILLENLIEAWEQGGSDTIGNMHQAVYNYLSPHIMVES